MTETNGRECNNVGALKDSHQYLKSLFHLFGFHVHAVIEPVITKSNRASQGRKKELFEPASDSRSTGMT